MSNATSATMFGFTILLGGCVADPAAEDTEAAATAPTETTDGVSTTDVSPDTDSAPVSCERMSYDNPDPELELCAEYYGSLWCCIPSSAGGVNEGYTPLPVCQSSFHFVGMGGNAPDAPTECIALTSAVIECAIAVAEVSCDDMSHFYAGYSHSDGTTPVMVAPPTDTTMPCFTELLATWDAGCQPFLI